MKITMYELYEKIYYENPPEHIRVYGEDWYWNYYDGYVTKDSLKTTPDAQIYLMDKYRTFMHLDQVVEIIEEEKKIPEKLDVISWDKCIHGVTHKEKELAIEINKTQETINEIIDYLKSKGE